MLVITIQEGVHPKVLREFLNSCDSSISQLDFNSNRIIYEDSTLAQTLYNSNIGMHYLRNRVLTHLIELKGCFCIDEINETLFDLGFVSLSETNNNFDKYLINVIKLANRDDIQTALFEEYERAIAYYD